MAGYIRIGVTVGNCGPRARLGEVADHETEQCFWPSLMTAMKCRLRFISPAAVAEHTDGRVALFMCPQKRIFSIGWPWALLCGKRRARPAKSFCSASRRRFSGKPERFRSFLSGEGDLSEELIKLMDEEPNISILVLAAGTEDSGPGPIISYLLGKGPRRLHADHDYSRLDDVGRDRCHYLITDKRNPT